MLSPQTIFAKAWTIALCSLETPEAEALFNKIKRVDEMLIPIPNTVWKRIILGKVWKSEARGVLITASKIINEKARFTIISKSIRIFGSGINKRITTTTIATGTILRWSASTMLPLFSFAISPHPASFIYF